MENIGLYITIGILVAILLLVLYAALYPRLRQYRFMVKRVGPKKKRPSARRAGKKKSKQVWIRIK